MARILRPWGRRGEVAAEILTDFPERLTVLREAWLAGGRTAPRLASIRSCRLHLGQAIFHFAGVDSISEAENLRGAEVRVPLAGRLPLGPGRYYISDLVGCEVWDRAANARLGTVTEVQRAGEETRRHPRDAAPEAWVLVVAAPGGEVLIPLAEEICVRIDPAARRIEVVLPEGLRELNAGDSGATPP